MKDIRQKAETIKLQTSINRNINPTRRYSDSATHCPGNISPFFRVFKIQPDKDLSKWSDLIADLALSLGYPTLLETALSFE